MQWVGKIRNTVWSPYLVPLFFLSFSQHCCWFFRFFKMHLKIITKVFWCPQKWHHPTGDSMKIKQIPRWPLWPHQSYKCSKMCAACIPNSKGWRSSVCINWTIMCTCPTKTLSTFLLFLCQEQRWVSVEAFYPSVQSYLCPDCAPYQHSAFTANHWLDHGDSKRHQLNVLNLLTRRKTDVKTSSF